MPPKKKSRAAEARSRRLLLRYEREIRDRLQPSSSDDDVIPPPIRINRQGNEPAPSQSETGPQTSSGIPRYAEGRLLFYGQPNPNRLTEPDSPANSSFSDDNANIVTEDRHTDEVASLDEAPLSTSPDDDEGSDVHNDNDSPTDDPPVADRFAIFIPFL